MDTIKITGGPTATSIKITTPGGEDITRFFRGVTITAGVDGEMRATAQLVRFVVDLEADYKIVNRAQAGAVSKQALAEYALRPPEKREGSY